MSYENIRCCIIKPNTSSYSETFIDAHIKYLPGNKKVLYGGFFPLYSDKNIFLIKSKLGLLIYFFYKTILKKRDIAVRTKALATYLINEKIQVVLAEYGPTAALVQPACKIAGVPMVIHFHGFDAHHYNTIKIYKDLYQRAFDYCSAIIGVSNDMVKNLITLGADKSKVYLNPYGINCKLFQPVDVLQSDIRFLAVARFMQKKAPLNTIKAFSKVYQAYPAAKLVMIGIGPLLEKSKKLVVDLGIEKAVDFMGVLNHEQIFSQMKNCRAFVQHSVITADGDSEGTPNSILEASAAGLPIISTKHAGIKEAVVHEKTGYLVEEHNVDAMADYMIKLAGNKELAAELGVNGAEHIRENYEMQQRINALAEILYADIKKY